MVAIVAFHLVMLLLAAVIATGVVSSGRVGDALIYVHKSIGVTAPSDQQVKMVALIWIGSLVAMVDGCLLLLVTVARFLFAK